MARYSLVVEIQHFDIKMSRDYPAHFFYQQWLPGNDESIKIFIHFRFQYLLVLRFQGPVKFQWDTFKRIGNNFQLLDAIVIERVVM